MIYNIFLNYFSTNQSKANKNTLNNLKGIYNCTTNQLIKLCKAAPEIESSNDPSMLLLRLILIG